MASPGKNENFFQSIKNASMGIQTTIREERNIKPQLFISFLVVVAGLFFQISRLEWSSLVICIGLVLATEHLNTAVENIVDLAANNQYHILAKKAKDASAGAVLIVSMMSVVVGMIVFIPKLWDLLLLFLN